MKIINGIAAVLSLVLALYTLFTAKKDAELVFSLALVILGIMFFCFVIIEEKTEEIHKLQIKLLQQKGIL